MSSSDWLLGFFWCSREESALLPFYCRESHGTSQSRQLTVNESGSLFTVLFFSSRALNDDYREGPNVWMSELQSCSDYCIHSLAARVCMNVPFSRFVEHERDLKGGATPSCRHFGSFYVMRWRTMNGTFEWCLTALFRSTRAFKCVTSNGKRDERRENLNDERTAVN